MSNIRQRTFDDKNDIDNLYKAVELESDERQALSETVSDMNKSLFEQGLLNLFDNTLISGGWDSTGTWLAYGDRASTTNISCKEGELISAFCNNSTAIQISFFNDSTFINRVTTSNKEFYSKVPANANSFVVTFVKTNSTSAVTELNGIRIYDNNTIDIIYDSLSGLKFSVSDTTLSITDGTNTWTLNA